MIFLFLEFSVMEHGSANHENILFVHVSKAVLMANLSSCDSDDLSEVPYSDTYPDDMIRMCKRCQSQDEGIRDTNSSAPNDLLVLSLVKQMTDQVANLDKENQTNKMVNESLTAELERYKELLKDTFNAFDKTLLDEITEVQNVFNQMEAAVDQCSIELLKKKYFVEKDVYDKLVKSYSTLEKHCIFLELATQLYQEIFQKDNSGENQNALTFNQLFEINELNAQSQEKDTVIRKLKDRIKSLTGKESVEKVKKDIDEIKTIDIKLEHSLAKLLSKNENLRKEREHLKSIYKYQFDSIKKTRVRTKEHSDSLIAQINAKSVENSDLNAQLQEKELLVYVSKTCLNLPKPSEKLVAVTSMNKDKKVRFAKPVTSSSNIPKQTDSLRPKDSNKPLLTSIGVNTTTTVSESKPSGNTKKNKTTRPPSSNQKNKVEVYPRLNLV
ncbi:hypothetical protein Tco_1109146 [Tanacetum coccineum]